jgi:hypothetical protein
MGFAAGFRAGSQTAKDAIDAYNAGKERRLKQQVGLESQRYDVTEGAYGQGLQQNIDQLKALAQQERGLSGEAAQQRARAEYEPSIAALQGRPEYAQNLEQVLRLQEDAGYRAANQTGLPAGPYEQAIRELERRRDMQAPDYTIGSRAQNFGTREEAEMAAKPMRTQGLANVYRQAGEIEEADKLLERADEQELRGIQTRAAKMTLAERERAVAAQQKLDSFEAWRAENPNVIGSQLKDVARGQFKLNDDQLLKVTSTITGLAENDLKQFQLEMKNAVKGKDLKGLTELYNTDDRLDPNTDLKVVRGKNGAVTLNFVDKQGNPISSQNFSSEALATAFLNKQATEPDQVAEWLLGVQRTQAAIAASNRASPGTPSLSQKIADAERALGRKLTDAEKAVMVGVQGRDRAPSAADLNARAKMYMESDPDLTAEQALAMAQSDLGGGLGGSASAPPGQRPGEPVWAPAAAPATAPAPAPAPAATKTAAPPRVGLSREQVGQAVTQQQTGVQAETRVRRAAITEFEQRPQVRQAYDAVRQLRRSGEAVRANNIENQINAQRERFIAARIGGGQ